jgi:flagellar motility protein MotE (MotC chaperone)
MNKPMNPDDHARYDEICGALKELHKPLEQVEGIRDRLHKRIEDLCAEKFRIESKYTLVQIIDRKYLREQALKEVAKTQKPLNIADLLGKLSPAQAIEILRQLEKSRKEEDKEIEEELEQGHLGGDYVLGEEFEKTPKPTFISPFEHSIVYGEDEE